MSVVQLHVYDVSGAGDDAVPYVATVNSIGRNMLGIGGVFHGGVEVFGKEWSFGFAHSGTGVYCCDPKANQMYTYRESVLLGVTSLSQRQVDALIARLKQEWPGAEYDLLEHNCNSFCEAFAKELGVDPPPGWVNRLARGASGLKATSNATRKFFSKIFAETGKAFQSLAPQSRASSRRNSSHEEDMSTMSTRPGSVTRPNGERRPGFFSSLAS